jgi:hypothetical protein
MEPIESQELSPSQPLCLSEKAASRMLGVCTRTLFNLRKSGQLHAIRIGTRGGRVLYPVSELRRFVCHRMQ